MSNGGAAAIVMADDGIAFDGRSLDSGPLGGAETAFVGLAQALAARGHKVSAFTRGTARFDHKGVAWAPIAEGLPDSCDLYIANRGTAVLDLVPRARRIAFWVHNPAGYMLKARYLWRLWRRRPTVIFLGSFHATTLPGWVPTGSRKIIAYGLSETFRHLEERLPPGPRAIFTSNPLRRLDWILDRWRDTIFPAVPDATLHVFSSLATYGGGSASKRAQAAPILAQAQATPGVILRAPLPKAALAQELGQTRVFLYGGDPGETFCLAAAESQAAGVPGVVARSTCLDERVRDGETGFVVADDDGDGFSARAVALLRDDRLWHEQHRACLALQRGHSWDAAAAQWEELLS